METSALLRQVDHRPWRLPRGPWALRMVWHDLAFLHWPVAIESLTPTLPSGLELDTFEGQAWIGVVPFGMREVGLRYLPPLPGFRHFPEINVRTYVRSRGKPGVWFYSLDVPSSLVAGIARRNWHLPYHAGKVSLQSEFDRVTYRSSRRHPAASFEGTYAPTGSAFRAVPGSLEAWLVERYCLYAANRKGKLFRGEIHHPRWPLQMAQVSIDELRMFEQIGLPEPTSTPLAHFAKRLDVVAWPLNPVSEE